MILSGRKTEEYREIKPFWLKRLSHWMFPGDAIIFKPYNKIVFTNGYAKDAPSITIECLGISQGYCKPEWSEGMQGKHFVIKLGKIISTKNIKK